MLISILSDQILGISEHVPFSREFESPSLMLGSFKAQESQNEFLFLEH